MTVYDRTREHVEFEAALLQAKPKFNWNPFSYIWTGMQHIAYFVAPANGCVYCLAWRMFFLGLLIGYELGFKFPGWKVW